MAWAQTSRLAALKSAIVDGLGQRSALAGVQIASAELGGDTAYPESIELIGEDLIEQEWAGIGRFSRDERLTLTGVIRVTKPGAGETVIRSARDRAFVLMAEVELFFVDTSTAPSVGGIVKAARAQPFELREFATPDGRLAMLGFQIVTELTRLQNS